MSHGQNKKQVATIEMRLFEDRTCHILIDGDGEDLAEMMSGFMLTDPNFKIVIQHAMELRDYYEEQDKAKLN